MNQSAAPESPTGLERTSAKRGAVADRRFRLLRMGVRSSYIAGETNISLLAGTHGVSRASIHRWMQRDAAAGHPWDGPVFDAADLEADGSAAAAAILRQSAKCAKAIARMQDLPRISVDTHPGAAATMLVTKAMIVCEMMLDAFAANMENSRPGRCRHLVGESRVFLRIVTAISNVVNLQRRICGILPGEPSDPRLIKVRPPEEPSRWDVVHRVS